MATNKLLTRIKEALNGLLISYFNKDIDETLLLKTLNETVHYNKIFQPYIYEMLFIQALEIKKIPRSSIMINMLFKDDNYLYPESYGHDATRMKILKHLNLKKSIKLYELYLIKREPESHMDFKDGVYDPKYIKAQQSNITFEEIRQTIIAELSS